MNTQTEQYRREQEALEQHRKEQEVIERLKGHDFIRALYEMVCPGVKK